MRQPSYQQRRKWLVAQFPRVLFKICIHHYHHCRTSPLLPSFTTIQTLYVVHDFGKILPKKSRYFNSSLPKFTLYFIKFCQNQEQLDLKIKKLSRIRWTFGGKKSEISIFFNKILRKFFLKKKCKPMDIILDISFKSPNMFFFSYSCIPSLPEKI